ncbi:MAG: hypothetical protein SCK57_08170 [Bacillota bacterium]|nr:hypothetical protein [Bacillota bacterium]MDW7677622.1 hypothetical protein [Bacillota bacterium]
MTFDEVQRFILKATPHCQDCRSRGSWVKSTHIYPDRLIDTSPLRFGSYRALCEICYRHRKAEDQ